MFVLTALKASEHEITLQFAYDGGGPGKGGTATILVDGESAAEGRVDNTMGFRISLDETFDVGADMGEPVSEEYEVPFETESLDRVEIRFDG